MEKQDFKEKPKDKLKEWHWKCYLCNYTNKYLKLDQCNGCKKYTKQTSRAFEFEYENRPLVKVEPTNQIEIAKPEF